MAPGGKGHAAAYVRAERIRASLAETCRFVPDRQVERTVSCGVSVMPRDDNLPAGERSSEGVVQFCDGHRAEVVRAGKFDLPEATAPRNARPFGAADQARGQGLAP